MSVGPLGGIVPGAAGSPLAQSHGSDVERAQKEVGDQNRRVQVDQKAESAAGIGEADGEDHETAERDADGRRLWEKTTSEKADDETPDDSQTPDDRSSKDTTGQSGNLLDLTG
ncbi:MAG: hypothetical protein ACYTG0_41270 [Planctomycetota bacterium]|jgi:hypothetical protein